MPYISMKFQKNNVVFFNLESVCKISWQPAGRITQVLPDLNKKFIITLMIHESSTPLYIFEYFSTEMSCKMYCNIIIIIQNSE